LGTITKKSRYLRYWHTVIISHPSLPGFVSHNRGRPVKTLAKKDQCHDEQVDFSGTYNSLHGYLPLEVAYGYSCSGAASFVQDDPDNSQKNDCRYDADAQDTDQKIEAGIMQGTGKLGNNSGEGFSERR
jgi:hypothetical protein